MTVEEKRNALEKYCLTHTCRVDDGDERPKCKYIGEGDDWCCHYNSFDVPEELLEEIMNEISDDESTNDANDANDIINHPSHYTHGGMECIDEMEMIFGRQAVMNFCLCNAWKYRKRAIYKNGEEDMQKSDWYIAKYQELKHLWDHGYREYDR